MRSWREWFRKGTAEGPASLPALADQGDLRGRRVLLRAGLNVPMEDGRVGERFRLEAALPTIRFLQEKGARTIIVAHIGREPDESLRPVARVLEEMAGVRWGGTLAQGRAATLSDGETILLENIRQDARETAGDDALARELADLAELYVNDAFADSHREHASITGVPKYLPACFGFSFIKEYEALRPVLQPKHPAVCIMSGAKFETKLPLITRFVREYDQVYVGGALANDLYKAKGYEVGVSVVSDSRLDLSALVKNPRIMLPASVLVEGPEGTIEKDAATVLPEERIVDIGAASVAALRPLLDSAATILWNGPLGNYEAGFAAGTEALARLVAASSAYSVVGGGDTIASIHSLGLSDKFGFLSTAGGAMLVFLETGTLPAIEAVLQSR